ncbi:DUF934 domain-containing protein [Diaphorobacter sp. HDW4A]|uniref:DUF934 domain-containing protein n=1 Tax=Diaphorobacter sp. HDW4A TaxID=2714924 RepID=UPI00140AA667|nr:DUF934 domain-containing protein [Diaphorobacter sp. HDW4A]QIL80462.1 DUF934 domain-containing protein [Diaphorobacter sp. HDW4A]
MQIFAANEHQPVTEDQKHIVVLPNDADPLALDLAGVERIDLDFPKFTDGRAFSQARLLRQRRQFAGEIRATGDVLIDQLVQMARCGFDVAVLREGVDKTDAQRQFERFNAFYQGDVNHPLPHFREAA